MSSLVYKASPIGQAISSQVNFKSSEIMKTTILTEVLEIHLFTFVELSKKENNLVLVGKKKVGQTSLFCLFNALSN